MLSGNAIKKFSEYFDLDFKEKLPPINLKKDPLQDLWIADIHAPYHNDELFKKTIEDNLHCKDLYIAGDWFDMYSKSHFRKTHDVDFRREFRLAYHLLKQAAQKYNRVYIMLSNHDERFKKWLFDHLPVDALEFANRFLIEDLLKLIPNLRIITQKIDKRDIGYIVQVQNVVFCHVEKSAKDIGKVVQEVEKDLQRWQSVFKLKPYNIVVQAHNHVGSKIRFDSKFLYQIPCLIDINEIAFDYVFSGKLQGNPPALGYIRAGKNEKGFYDPNKTHIVDYL